METILCELPELTPGTTRQRIQVFPPASDKTYAHPKAKFKLTQEALDGFAADINNRDNVVVDRDHAFAKGITAPAAAWFVPGSAEVTPNGLFADVDYTPSAAEQVANREYRFISPEFSFTTRRNDGKVEKVPHVYAATLTNRPFFDEMQAITAEDMQDEAFVAELVEDGVLLAEDIDDTVQIEASMSSKMPYGKVAYADPGMRDDGKHRYPIDTEEHTRAAWSYINKTKNAAKYSAEQLSKIKARIKRAAKKFGITIGADATEGGTMDFTAVAEALGLTADATEDDVLEAAQKVAAENADLKAKIDKLPGEDAIKDLLADAQKGVEASNQLALMRRDAAIKDAIDRNAIVPAQKENFEGFWAIDPDGTAKLLAEMPSGTMLAPKGAVDARVYAADGTPLTVGENGEAIAADTTPKKVDGVLMDVDADSAKIHAAAEAHLRSQGKTDYTADEYALACEAVMPTLGISR